MRQLVSTIDGRCQRKNMCQYDLVILDFPLGRIVSSVYIDNCKASV